MPSCHLLSCEGVEETCSQQQEAAPLFTWGSAKGQALLLGAGGEPRTLLPVLTSSCLVPREQQEREREKALQLQKERLQRELEEKKKKVKGKQA